MWSVHTVEYYSALKRKEILTHVPTWMNLEDVMLSEVSQTHRTNAVRVPLCEGPGVVRLFIDPESRLRFQGLGGGQGGSWCLTGTEF